MRAYAGITTGSSPEEPKVAGPYDTGQYGITVTDQLTVYGDRGWLEALRDVIDAALQGTGMTTPAHPAHPDRKEHAMTTPTTNPLDAVLDRMRPLYNGPGTAYADRTFWAVEQGIVKPEDVPAVEHTFESVQAFAKWMQDAGVEAAWDAVRRTAAALHGAAGISLRWTISTRSAPASGRCTARNWPGSMPPTAAGTSASSSN